MICYGSRLWGRNIYHSALFPQNVALECPNGEDYRPIIAWDDAKDSVPSKILKSCTGFTKPSAIQVCNNVLAVPV